MLVIWLHRLFFLSFLIFSFLCGMLIVIFSTKMIDFSVLENYNPGKPTILLDDEGKEWARFELDRREPVTIDHMPKHLLHAFISAEDHSFYDHSGISFKGIVRSALINIYHGNRVQGASTITQQLVKLLFFDSKKTFIRKFKEQCYALLVEHQFSKEQILEIYLNHLYFGSGIYGVKAAAQRFWGIDVKDITIDQAATLAAIIRSPGKYCPLQFPLSATRRRNVILNSMKRLGYIREEQYTEAKNIPLVTAAESHDEIAAHLKESLRQQLEKMVGRTKLYTGGLKVQTTINRHMQDNAHRIFKEKCSMLRKRIPDFDGAVVSVAVKTGEIKAAVGGYDFATSKFNRALQARRQLGSIFKPIIYAAAINNGSTFMQTEIDEPFELTYNNQVWRPGNYNLKFEGQMTLARALTRSNNVVAIKTFLNLGGERIKELADKFHLPNIQPYPSLALGCVDVTLVEAVGCFNVFANDGVYVEPHVISWIKDEWGNKIFRQPSHSERILSSRVNSQVAKVLTNGMERKRKKSAEWLDCEAIGKTGTTNDCRTCWFCGSTPEITTAVYVGCDDNRPMGHNIFAINTAFPIWLGLHKVVPTTTKKFLFDSSLHELIIDSRTGLACADVDSSNACAILI